MPGPDFWRVPVHSGKNLRGETRFGFSKNPTGEFLKSWAMKEGGRFCEHPLLPPSKNKKWCYFLSRFLSRIRNFLIKTIRI